MCGASASLERMFQAHSRQVTCPDEYNTYSYVDTLYWNTQIVSDQMLSCVHSETAICYIASKILKYFNA